jgi:ribonucleoside-diphosphate reductase alpha chain
VEDSREGWATAFSAFLQALYNGERPNVDFSKIRQHGERLKTMGGRASGPDALRNLMDYVVSTFVTAGGRHLTAREVHDIVCQIAEVVVIGGVRRSALISLSDLDDDEMRHAKSNN